MSRHLATLTQDMRDEQRLHDLAHNDEADRRFDTDLHRVQHDPCRNCPYRLTGEGEGRDCECCREASEAALRGLWTTVRNTVRSLTVSDWLAIACLAAVIGSFWAH